MEQLKHKIQTVIWDWNGTLLDDVALCAELINEMLTLHGYAPLGDMNAYKRVFRFPIEAYYRDAGFDFSRHPYPQLAETYMSLYTPRSAGCPLQPHAADTLRALREKGIRQSILSASQRDLLSQQVARYGITDYFDALVGIDTVLGNSKAEVGLAWLRQSGVAPEHAVMVGDSVHDCAVAREMGTACVLYSRGHQPRAVLEATGCPVIDDLSELLPLLAEAQL